MRLQYRFCLIISLDYSQRIVYYQNSFKKTLSLSGTSSNCIHLIQIACPVLVYVTARQSEACSINTIFRNAMNKQDTQIVHVRKFYLIKTLLQSNDNTITLNKIKIKSFQNISHNDDLCHVLYCPGGSEEEIIQFRQCIFCFCIIISLLKG